MFNKQDLLDAIDIAKSDARTAYNTCNYTSPKMWELEEERFDEQMISLSAIQTFIEENYPNVG